MIPSNRFYSLLAASGVATSTLFSGCSNNIESYSNVPRSEDGVEVPSLPKENKERHLTWTRPEQRGYHAVPPLKELGERPGRELKIACPDRGITNRYFLSGKGLTVSAYEYVLGMRRVVIMGPGDETSLLSFMEATDFEGDGVFDSFNFNTDSSLKKYGNSNSLNDLIKELEREPHNQRLFDKK